MISYEKNLLNFGKQLSFKNLSSFNLKKLAGTKPDGLVICGMGGSGAPGEILKNLQAELKLSVPVVILKDSNIPFLAGVKKPLFVFISFSGETSETISAFNSALKMKNKACIAVITAGRSDSDESSDSKSGKLEKIAQERQLPLVTFNPGCLTPREASGIMFYGLLKILKVVLPLHIPTPPKLISPNRLKKLGEKLAEAAKNRNILVYTDSCFPHLGYIWKTNFNETAKTPAFANIYPELNHNEIAGFEKGKSSWIIFWLKEKSSFKTDKKIKLIAKILGEKGIKSMEIVLEGKNKNEKTWNGIALSHWIAFYLAKANGVDPRKTKIIQKLKNK